MANKTILALSLFCCLSVGATEHELRPFPEFAKARALTTGPREHFLANYFGINPWSPDNRYVLVLETELKDKMPDGTPCTLGLVDTRDGNKFIPVTTTRCWNFQEAAMAHWLPWAEDTFVFNDIRDGRFCAVVMNWKTKAERHFPYPVSAVSEDGEWAVSINYARLFITRPDYGYYGDGQDPRKGVVFPNDDGLWRVNLRTGEARLIVSTSAVKDMVPAVTSPDGMSYLCHTVISKDMKRIYFLARSVEESFEGVKKFKGVRWQTTAFTCNADGSNIRRCFPDGWGSSHFNWKPALSERDARTMIVTCNWQNKVYTHVEFTVGEEEKAHQVGGDEMNFDGHCIYSPDGEFVSGDGYFDKKGFRHWKMVRLADGAIKDLGDWWTPEIYRDIYCRCDLHPRWRPDGIQMGFNSVHEGSRQVYVMDVVENPPVKRKVAAGAIVLKTPADGATVPLLSEMQKAFMRMTREEREQFFDDAQPKKEKAIKRYRSEPQPVRLSWTGKGPFEVSVAKRGDTEPWFCAVVPSNRVDVWNLEIGRTYDWTVRAGGECAKGTFSTEDMAPRLIRVPGVPNIRDIGGRVINGRRVRQGLVYRSSGLNNNAKGIFYTYDEIVQLEAEGKLSGMGYLGAKYSKTLKAGKELDREYLRLKKPKPSEPGTARLTEEWREYMRSKLGIKTDIDLRSNHERFGMTGSPLGPGVNFVTMEDEYHGYAAVHKQGAEDTRRVLRVFLDRANYPIDFHCIGGADRTGTVATILHGILGLNDDEIWKDYQITAWQGGVNDAKHLGWFKSFVKSFDKFEGATLAERIQKYVLWLGFTERDIKTIREIMFEPEEK